MFRPSTAPRWKIVTSTLRRGTSAAATVRARNCRREAEAHERQAAVLQEYASRNHVVPTFSGIPGSRARAPAPVAGCSPWRWSPLWLRQTRRQRGGDQRLARHRDRRDRAALKRLHALAAVSSHRASRQRQREVHAVQQRARVDPRFRLVGIAGRRLAHVERHAERRAPRRRRQLRVARLGAGRAHGRDDELERRLDLRAVGLGGEELGRGHDRAHDLADVAVGLAESLRGPIDQRRRRRRRRRTGAPAWSR